MQNKKRPQYIERQLKQINDVLRSKRMKYEDHYSDNLFRWFTDYLIQHGWYKGFNMHHDVEVNNPDGTTKIIRALCGTEYETMDYYIQIW